MLGPSSLEADRIPGDSMPREARFFIPVKDAPEIIAELCSAYDDGVDAGIEAMKNKTGVINPFENSPLHKLAFNEGLATSLFSEPIEDDDINGQGSNRKPHFTRM